jgi:hypothetical protein
MESIPLGEILKQINLNDLSILVKDSSFRNLIMSSANFREVETRVILKCIDQLEKNLDTNFFFELLDDYFEPKGYDALMYRDTQAYKNLMNLFYNKLNNFSEFDDDILENLREMQENNEDIADVSNFLSNWIDGYPRLRNLFNQVETRSEQIQNEYIKQIKKELFESSDSAYQNVQDYLDVVVEYLDKYYQDSPKANEFYECIDQIEKIQKLFASVVSKEKGKKGKPKVIATKSIMR